MVDRAFRRLVSWSNTLQQDIWVATLNGRAHLQSQCWHIHTAETWPRYWERTAKQETQKRHHGLLAIYASDQISLLGKGGSSHLCIRLVRGSISFFPNRGSSGVSAPNWDTNKDAFSPRFLRNLKFSHSLMELFEYQKCQSRIVLKMGIPWSLLTYQFNDLYENPVIGGWGHELEEKWGQRQIVLRVSPSQLADNVYCCRLHT